MPSVKEQQPILQVRVPFLLLHQLQLLKHAVCIQNLSRQVQQQMHRKKLINFTSCTDIQEKNTFTLLIAIQIIQLLLEELVLLGIENYKQPQMVMYIRNIAREQALLFIVHQLQSFHLTLWLSDFIKLK